MASSPGREEYLLDKHTNRVLMFAQKQRAFAKRDLEAHYGKNTAQAVVSLARAGKLMIHAQGVYSLPTVSSEDPLVKEIIKRTGAKPISEERIQENRQRVDERCMQEMLKSSKVLDYANRLRSHIDRNPVFLRHEIAEKFGQQAYKVIQQLIEEGFIRKIYDGLYAASWVDPTGPEVREKANRLANHRQYVYRQIEAINALYDLPAVPIKDVKLRHWQRPGRHSRVYMDLPGMIPIYAEASKGGFARWKSADNSYPPAAAEAIAARVFEDAIEYHELVRIANSCNEKVEPIGRCGSFAAMPPTSEPRRTPYGASDIDQLDLKGLAERLPGPVDLIVDAAEPDAMFTLLCMLPNLRVHRTDLEVGDYLVPGRLLIERKTTSDLVQSLLDQDNRLSRQVHAMEAFEGRRLVIIEGGLLNEPDNRVGLAKRLRARSRLQNARGITVTETIGMRGTAYEILLAIQDTANEQAKTAPMPATAKSLSPYDVSIAMLRVIRGISLARAEALVARYNDIASISRVHPTELAEAAGMDLEIAEVLYEALNGRPAPLRKLKLRVVGRD